MKLATKIIVYFTSFLYFSLGVLFIVIPVSAAEGLGYHSLSPAGILEVRASYGGLWISLSIFIIYLMKRELVREALFFCLISFLGFGIGRLIGAILNGGFAGNHLMWFLFELVYCVICLFFFLKKK